MEKVWDQILPQSHNFEAEDHKSNSSAIVSTLDTSDLGIISTLSNLTDIDSNSIDESIHKNVENDEAGDDSFEIRDDYFLGLPQFGDNLETNFGFKSDLVQRLESGPLTVVLHSPTSALGKRNETPVTYLNKDQCYDFTLHWTTLPSASKGLFASNPTCMLTSLVSIQIPPDVLRENSDVIKAWKIWFTRRKSAEALRICYSPNSSQSIKTEVVSPNAVRVTWDPSIGKAYLKISIGCLSTDFSNQKGVKGIPLYIRVDTFDGDSLVDRCAAKIKTFCDKGADRKQREEEKRILKQANFADKDNFNFQSSRAITIFNILTNQTEEPFLFSPETFFHEKDLIKMDEKDGSQRGLIFTRQIPEPRKVPRPLELLSNSTPKPTRPKKPKIEKLPFLYVRQENEALFTSLTLNKFSLEELVRAISEKYQIEITDVRHLFKRTQLGAIIYVDEDFVIGLRGSFYIMKVLVVDGVSSIPGIQTRPMYDIILCEINVTD